MCPEQFQVGQKFRWKNLKGNDIIGVITRITESFVYMRRTIGDQEVSDALFLLDTLENLIYSGKVTWLTDS